MLKKKHLLLIICIMLLIGVSVYKDYGFGYDEHINRANGEISFNYVEKVISSIRTKNQNEAVEARKILDNYRDKDYGVAFDLPMMAIEKLLKLEDSQKQFMLRHGMTHLLFLIALLFFYKLINNRFNSYILSLTGVVLIYISPRIFAESFYNNKDIVFMSFFIISLYYSVELIKKLNFKNSFFAGIMTALAIDVRIVGIILLGIVIVGWSLETIKNKKLLNDYKNISFIILYLVVLIFFTIAMWPWLWTEPIDHFSEAIINMSNFRWLNWVLYRGHYYISTDLPWHYLPVWIAITTPLVYLVLFLYGNFVILKRTISYKFNLYKDKNELVDLAITAVFIVPLIAVVMLKSTIYDGWRQFYFLYPSLIYISIIGLSALLKSYIKYIIIVILIFEIISTSFWMVKNHPYQFVYFNKLSGNEINKNFEMDYWGITNIDALKKILRLDDSLNIKVYGLGSTSIPQAFLLLNRLDSSRISNTSYINNADYIVTNYRVLDNKQHEADLQHIKKYFIPIFDIKVENNIVGSVFKKKKFSH